MIAQLFYSQLMWGDSGRFIVHKQVRMRALRDKSNVIKLPTTRFMWGNIAHNVRMDGRHINAVNLSR